MGRPTGENRAETTTGQSALSGLDPAGPGPIENRVRCVNSQPSLLTYRQHMVRLSALHRRILADLHPLVVAECVRQGEHEEWELRHRCGVTVPLGDLRAACADYWQPDPDRSHEQAERAKVSAFSRSLTTLLRGGYVDGEALAWCSVGYAPDGRDLSGDLLHWQGGGRRSDSQGSPRLLRVGLTEIGWFLVTHN
jgi:hypothetical protein